MILNQNGEDRSEAEAAPGIHSDPFFRSLDKKNSSHNPIKLTAMISLCFRITNMSVPYH
jgi:hypothetical protein